MDLLYGKERTLPKFRVLELAARIPYQAWENVAYVAVTHTSREPGFARPVFDTVRPGALGAGQRAVALAHPGRTDRRGTASPSRYRLIPQVLAFAYYQLSWMMYVVRPAWSYRLNADFADHAEHEYAHIVDEHPEWDTTPFKGMFTDDFGEFESLADLFRQIGYDERLHKQESEARMRSARFR